MIGGLMLYSALVAALLLGAAFAGEFVIRAFGPPTRFVWAAAIGLTLALPAARFFRSSPAALPVPTAAFVQTNPAPARGPVLFSRSLAAAPQVLRTTVSRIDTNTLDAWDRPLLVAWLVGSGVLFGYLVLALAGLARLERRMAPDVVDGQRVLLSRDVGPALLGIVSMRIVMPRWVLDLTAAERRIVFAHETEHAIARDPALLFACFVALAMQPWNLAVWLMVARLRYAIEADCDERVVNRNVERRAYGELLLRVHMRSTPVLGARLAFVGMTSKLEGRIRRMVRGRPRLFTWAGGASLIGATLCAVTAWVTPLPAHPSRSSTTALPSHAGAAVPIVHLATARLIPDSLTNEPAGERVVTSAFAATAASLQKQTAQFQQATAGLAGTLRDAAARLAQAKAQLGSLEPCGTTGGGRSPSSNQLERLARERHPAIMESEWTEKPTIIAFVIDAASCMPMRDTAFETRAAGKYEAGELLHQAFPDLARFEEFGMSNTTKSDGNSPNVFIAYGITGVAPTNTMCAIPLNGRVCTIDGSIVIRRVDATRALVAVVAPEGATGQRRNAVFTFTSADPLPDLLSRSIEFAHVEFSGGELYVVSRSGSDPSLLFRVANEAHRLGPANATTFENLQGLAYYGWQDLTADQIHRLARVSCPEGSPTDQCYGVDGSVVHFPL